MIYTFYSFKGGVGRSMALANVAELFYQAGRSVLMVDWDLEAPGLERYFPVKTDEILDQPGLIDLLLGYKKQMAQKLALQEEEQAELPFEKPGQFTVEIYPPKAGQGQLLLLPAGRRRTKEQFAAYAQAVHTFDWVDFYQNWEGELYFEWLREQFARIAEVILIDSRTGVTEMGGVCTQHLADTVVMFCTPNQQNLEGTSEMARYLKQDRLHYLRGDRPLEIVIVPARVEDRAEAELLNAFQAQFVDRFDQFLPAVLRPELESFWQLKIPHVPYYAFQEIVAVREKATTFDRSRAGAEDMVDAFKKLTQALAKLDPALLSDEEAIDFYLTTQAWDKAIARLTSHKLKALYQTNQVKLLDDWFARFPLAELEQQPRLLLWWGQILNDNLGQPKRAMTLFNLAEAQFRRQGQLVEAIKAQIWQSVGLRMTGQAREAIKLAAQGLQQLQTLAPTNGWLIAWATRNRGLAHGTAGNFDQALLDTWQALAQFKRLDDLYMVGLCHHDLGVSLVKQGQLKEAEAHYRQASEIWQRLGNENDLANTLIGLGEALCVAGRYEEAIVQFTTCLDLSRRIGAIRRAAFAQAGLGDAYLASHRYEEAVKAYQISTGYAQDARIRSLEVANQIKLSDCFYHLAPHYPLTEALEQARHGRQIATEQGLSFERTLAGIVQAKIHLRMEQYAESFDLWAEAVAYFAETNPVEYLNARLWWAYSLYLARREAEALAHLQKVLKIAPTLGEEAISSDISQTLVKVEAMLYHFMEQRDVPAEVKNGLRQLLMLYPQAGPEAQAPPPP